MKELSGRGTGVEAKGKKAMSGQAGDRICLNKVATFLAALKRVDLETGGHLRRMGYYSALLYEKCGYDVPACTGLGLAAMLHDVGKLWTPPAILNKPGRLNPKERHVMRQHADAGYQILRHSASPVLQLGAIIARGHHERWNGGGYPQGLKAKEIPLVARVVAVADVFDALLSQRCYKRSWPLEKVLQTIRQGQGRHFDPDLIDILFAHLDDFLNLPVQWLADQEKTAPVLIQTV